MAVFACLLHLSECGIGLKLTGNKAPGAIRCDFVTGAVGHRRKFGGGRGQDLCKAVGLDKSSDLHIVDMTAGLGRDSFVLASLGATVTMVERNPVVHALLEDGLDRAVQFAIAEDSELLMILQRITLKSGDAKLILPVIDNQIDVIYLDPMFPGRKKSAKVKKEMQAFHLLVGDDPDSAELLATARGHAKYRVVVKRPSKSGFLAAVKPSHSILGKSTRFDIYTNKSIVKYGRGN